MVWESKGERKAGGHPRLSEGGKRMLSFQKVAQSSFGWVETEGGELSKQ